MGWWSTLIGGTLGFAIGGPIGAIVGAALGHAATRGNSWAAIGKRGSEQRIQMVYFTTTFAVMGHVTKADGRVSENEIQQARVVMQQMNLDQSQREMAIRLFQQGKQANFQLEAVLAQFRSECHQRQALLRLFVEIQLQAALADGDIAPEQRRIFNTICRQLRIPAREFARLEQAARGDTPSDARTNSRRRQQSTTELGGRLGRAYRLLDVAPDASDAQIKRNYRRLINQNHPDKLVAKGLPEEMMKVAEHKTQQIISAYELIKESRDM